MAETSKQVFADKEELRKELHLPDPKSLTVETVDDVEQSIVDHADDLVARILNTEMNDDTSRREVKNAVENMGLQLQKESAHRSAMLKQPLSRLMQDSKDGGEVARSLIDLKVQVEDLDPMQFDLNGGWFTRILGYIPGMGTPMKRYFSRFESASTSIDSIISSLEKGKEQLKRDNITLTDDQKRMRDLTIKLEKTIKLGNVIDKKLQSELDNTLTQDDPRYKFISEELLFPLRQRIMDLQQQLLVNQQGYLTTEMIIRNNKELIRGVNRALNTTVGALQIGVTLALALANQKIVLDKVQAINKTTASLIAGTAERLKTQGAEIHKQASSSQVDIAVLKKAFEDITIALDDISTYRQEALPEMAKNILELDELAGKAEAHIKQVEKAEAIEGDFSLEIID